MKIVISSRAVAKRKVDLQGNHGPIQAIGQGPFNFDIAMARTMDWSETEIARVVELGLMMTRRTSKAAARRQGRTAVCEACECYYDPTKGGCRLCAEDQRKARKARREDLRTNTVELMENERPTSVTGMLQRMSDRAFELSRRRPR
jgi:hypothetical protein